MMRARILGAACVVSLLSFGVVGVGCSASEQEKKPASTETVGKASVAITVHDANGTRIGEGSGTLIAPRLVLTAAHLVAGKSSWLVKTSDGRSIRATRGLSYDWRDYGSSKSHPRRYDVAVLYLEEAVTLSSYPALADQKLASGASATRISGAGLAQKSIASSLESLATFPRAYVTTMAGNETLDTGGAVVNDQGQIVGVVMGRGLTTSKLYVSRTDSLPKWLAPKMICAGAASAARTYGVPPGSSGGTSGTSGGTSGGSSGTSGSSGTNPNQDNNPGSSGGGGGDNCNDGGGLCYGSSCGPNGGPDGSQDTPPGGGAASGSGGPSATPPAGSGSGGGGTGLTPGEACSGEDDNPDLCPPEDDGCSGTACGGGVPDPNTDFGFYTGGGGSSGTGTDVH